MKDDSLRFEKLDKIYELVEQIREVRKLRKEDFTPSIFMWSIFNECSDNIILDKVIARIQIHLNNEESWFEDEKIINLDDYRK